MTKGTALQTAATGEDGSAAYTVDLPIAKAIIFQRHRLLTHIIGTASMYTALRSTICRRQLQRQHLPTLSQMTGQPQKAISTRWIRKQEKQFRRGTQSWRAQSMVCMPVTILRTRTAQQALFFHAGDLVATLTTDEGGNAEVKNLYLGSYYVKEITPSGGHLLDEDR